VLPLVVAWMPTATSNCRAPVHVCVFAYMRICMFVACLLAHSMWLCAHLPDQCCHWLELGCPLLHLIGEQLYMYACLRVCVCVDVCMCILLLPKITRLASSIQLFIRFTSLTNRFN
jgi:hypothetical protein